MSKELSASNQPLEKVFSSDYQLTIPRYQRPYAWTADETLQLLEDLQAAAPSDGEPYFLGSIVLVNTGGVEHDVIDGQQRLTTTTILMAVLRDLAASTNSKLAEGIQSYLADSSKAWKADAVVTPRLTLRPKDADFFRAWVQTPGNIEGLIGLTDNAAQTDSMQNIRGNAKALYGALKPLGAEAWEAFFEFLLERTELVVVATEDKSSAHRIFSVLNARGLDLSPTDIFKSDLIGEVAPEKEDAYADKWDEAEEAVGRQDFTDLFRDIRTIVSGQRAKRELLKEFPEQVLSTWLSTETPEQVIDNHLVPYAEAFAQVMAPAFGPGQEWDEVNEWLRRLDRLDNTDWRPIVLWILRHHSDDPVTLSRLLRKVERLAASLLLRRAYATPRAARYLDLLSQLKSGDGTEAQALTLSDAEKAEARNNLDGDLYQTYQSKRLRYILLRLDSLLANKPGVQYFPAQISIEHVLPQTPAAGSDWVADFNELERETWTHRLGNLLLLSRIKNGQAQNYDFAKKKAKYFDTHGSAVFALTTQVLQHTAWTPEVVADRQELLVGRLVKEWGLD
ncbi:DUF262 domain-containing protein [Janibacter anophelis]|uniref:DUF262 domain-containing protein n=1 Tax=Janibacter anophelis TaxID=319054 RepID=UPI003F8222DC